MRVFTITTIITTALSCSGCVSGSNNQAYESSYNRAIALNGFWDGQFDQSGAVRLLIYEGNIYGFDDSRGFTGTAEYDTSERSVSMSLESRWITGNDEAQGEMMSSGTASNVGVDALLIDESDGTGLIVGTYATGLNAGAITLKADGSWKNSSSLWNTLGVWQAGTTSLYITEVDGRAKFVGQGADSCSFDGELFLLNTDYPLLKAHIYSRSGCNFFTVSTPVDGYAAITSEGMLEFYFTSDSELLRLEYSR